MYTNYKRRYCIGENLFDKCPAAQNSLQKVTPYTTLSNDRTKGEYCIGPLPNLEIRSKLNRSLLTEIDMSHDKLAELTLNYAIRLAINTT